MQAPRLRLGFTLLELLVVITIIGLLASVGLASYSRAQARARDARRQSDLTTVRNSLEIYYAENNSYVSTSDIWRDASEALSVLDPIYIRGLPDDPGGAGSVPYRYTSVSNGQGYCLAANLETADTTQSSCTVTLETGYDYGLGNP